MNAAQQASHNRGYHSKCHPADCDFAARRQVLNKLGGPMPAEKYPTPGEQLEDPPRKKTPRGEVLFEAESLINGDRNNQYGPPAQDFDRTARLWTAEFEHLLKEGMSFQGHHVALAMALLKISRLAWSPGKRDSWVDGAGYLGCGFECAQNEAKIDIGELKEDDDS